MCVIGFTIKLDKVLIAQQNKLKNSGKPSHDKRIKPSKLLAKQNKKISSFETRLEINGFFPIATRQNSNKME